MRRTVSFHWQASKPDVVDSGLTRLQIAYSLAAAGITASSWFFTRGYLDGWRIPENPNILASLAFMGRSLLSTDTSCYAVALLFIAALLVWAPVRPLFVTRVLRSIYSRRSVCSITLAITCFVISLLNPGGILGKVMPCVCLISGFVCAFLAARSKDLLVQISLFGGILAVLIAAYRVGLGSSDRLLRDGGHNIEMVASWDVRKSSPEVGDVPLELIWSDDSGWWGLWCDGATKVASIAKFGASGERVRLVSSSYFDFDDLCVR